MQPLSNLQLELLNVFSRPVSDEDLLAIRRFLANYFAEKAMNLADEVWDQNQWTDEDAVRMMNEHQRTPST
ncbi:hypothetical protein GCM10027190_48170 [Spirosoma areae]